MLDGISTSNPNSVFDIDRERFIKQHEPNYSRIEMNYNWFVGVLDGEGTFCIHLFKQKKRKSFHLNFSCVIQLQQEDSHALVHLQQYLDIGKINFYSRTEKRKAIVSLSIHKNSDIKKLIKIIDKYPLQFPTKQSAFEIWKQAFLFYINSNPRKGRRTPKEVILKIAELKELLNNIYGRKSHPIKWTKEKIKKWYNGNRTI